jgi:mRNA-capping enzyme
MDYAKYGIVAFRNKYFDNNPQEIGNEDFDIEEKKQWDMSDIMDLKRFSESPDIDHNTDGVIFTPVEEKFHSGRFDLMLKMKPIELNSVDFRASWKDGVCYLSVTNRLQKEIEFVPISILDFANDELKQSLPEGSILECVMDITQQDIDNDPEGCWFSKGWKPLRIRQDKGDPNIYSTFVGVFKSIKDDISYETIHEMFPK